MFLCQTQISMHYELAFRQCPEYYEKTLRRPVLLFRRQQTPASTTTCFITSCFTNSCFTAFYFLLLSKIYVFFTAFCILLLCFFTIFFIAFLVALTFFAFLILTPKSFVNRHPFIICNANTLLLHVCGHLPFKNLDRPYCFSSPFYFPVFLLPHTFLTGIQCLLFLLYLPFFLIRFLPI